MLQNFTVRNFRCFSGLSIGPLGRVNVIAGKNNVGKTALLEAIHLHNNPANWQLPLNVNRERGIQDPSRDLDGVCGWLFYRKHAAGGLVLMSQDGAGVGRTLSMFIMDATAARQQFPEHEKALAPTINPSLLRGSLSRLVLKYEQSNEPEHISIGVAGENLGGGSGSAWIDARIPWKMPSVYLSSNGAPSMQDVSFFGELERNKRQSDILPTLKIVEPRLEHLSLVPLAGESVIHGDIGLPELMPLAFMGEGVRRSLSIVLAIANAPGGIVLIDEIENGLHHSVMQKVWQAIGHAARQADVQVFATTHNYQCIDAAHEAFSAGATYDLRLHRLDRIGEEIKVVTYDQQSLNSALKFNMEVR